MATAALVVLLAGVVLTVVGVAGVVRLLTRRVRRSIDEVSESFRRLEPRLQRLEEIAAVRTRELERLGHTTGALTTARERRRRTASGARPTDS